MMMIINDDDNTNNNNHYYYYHNSNNNDSDSNNYNLGGNVDKIIMYCTVQCSTVQYSSHNHKATKTPFQRLCSHTQTHTQRHTYMHTISIYTQTQTNNINVHVHTPHTPTHMKVELKKQI